MRWFTSDTHFGHKNVIEYERRPFGSSREMDEYMIARWNERVKPDDEVYFLGDFGLTNIKYLTSVCSVLRGYKICIRGNHDGTATRQRRIGFDLVMDRELVEIAGVPIRLQHHPEEEHQDTLILHGHVHSKGSKTFKNNHMCVCVELWNYAPVSEETIAEEIKKHMQGVSDG